MRIIIISFFLLICFHLLCAQNATISGRLLEDSGEVISGANVYLQGTVLGAASDREGLFFITGVPQGSFRLVISMIGHVQRDTTLVVIAGARINLGDIVLQTSPLQLQPIIVTASKYEQSIQDVPATIYTVTTQQMDLRNTISVDKALEYVPGVNMNSDQVNIRGSSGYSRGVGSRVMVLVDGVPFITGDTQGAVFEALPINNVDKLEIVKGAGSALYGSSAIGGVINIITRPIDQKPELNAKIYGGMYDDPYYSEWEWSERKRFSHGLQLDYATRFGIAGLKLAAAHDGDDSYRRNDWRRRYNFGGKIELDLSPFDLIMLSGNYMDQKRGNFLYWQDLQRALEPPQDQIGETVHSKRFYLSSRYRKIFTDQKFLKTDVMWFQNRFDDNVGIGNQSTSNFFHLEIQYNTTLNNHHITVGITPTYSEVSSNIFGSRDGYGFAAYVQDELKFSDKWILTAGTRYDAFDIDALETGSQLSPKIGLVFKPYNGTAFRLQAGSGFRAPSMAEAFTSTVAGGLTVEPNPNLKPEESVSAELGWNQFFGTYLATDFSVFYNYYWDLIEGGFQESGNIRFDNITEARIIGFETNLHMRLLDDRLTTSLAYTYIDPQDINSRNFLKYRPRHLIYSSAQFRWNRLTVGLDYRYLSRYDRIDDNFAFIIPDAQQRVSAHIVDVQSAVALSGFVPATITFQINNILQYNYIDLIGSIAPIRSFVLTLETNL